MHNENSEFVEVMILEYNARRDIT